MRVFFTTAICLCYLVACLGTSQAAHGLGGRLEQNSDDTVPSSHAFRYKLMSMGEDGGDDDDDDDDDSDDNGKENLGFAEDDDSDDSDSEGDEGFALLESDIDEDDDGVSEEDGEPPQGYIQVALEDEKVENSDEPAQANYISYRSLIYHGHRVVLQQRLYNYYWLDCGTSSNSKCTCSNCPRVNFDSQDYRRCYGLVFRIYRYKGRGRVRNGDIVALHIPKRNRWFGCPHSLCGRYSCPGKVNYNYGFQSRAKWCNCGGEIFRIYARNKRIGASITDNDQVGLYFIAQKTWVYRSGSKFVKNKCMGTTLPPNQKQFESCYKSSFDIHRI